MNVLGPKNFTKFFWVISTSSTAVVGTFCNMIFWIFKKCSFRMDSNPFWYYYVHDSFLTHNNSFKNTPTRIVSYEGWNQCSFFQTWNSSKINDFLWLTWKVIKEKGLNFTLYLISSGSIFSISIAKLDEIVYEVAFYIWTIFFFSTIYLFTFHIIIKWMLCTVVIS